MVVTIPRCLLACAAALGIAAGAAAADLREGFAAAGALSPRLQALAAERSVLLARRERSEALTPGAPFVLAGYRSDRLPGDRGLREYEGEVGLPLWLPGETRALRAAAVAQLAALDAAVARERLLLAGEVRAGWWAWQDAVAARRAAQGRVAQARALERDLGRQVAGGLAPEADRLAVAAALREAETALRIAERAVRQEAVAFRALTGRLPSDGPAEAEAAPPGEGADPRIAAARAAEAAGRAAEGLVRLRDRANPEVVLQFRHERDARGEPWGSRLAVLFTIPLGHPPLQRERLAAAQAVTTAGTAAALASARAVAGGIALARENRDAAGAVLHAAGQRQAALAEQAALYEAGWRAGELPLIEVIRVRTALAEAEAARLRARVALGRAGSALNHAFGVEPR
ncbi:TolC family protein [Roseomonas sp. NAR14]|uniref:TolC family protein n=1 Tax=Roseomonas acroporae TaxID=2937791 RepID=A0A9X1Y6M7_9PROT|nr:TolC family protein [Roseomonas acroporae]MCK8784461.1 TolC family protein [Roseomonas acroporae]